MGASGWNKFNRLYYYKQTNWQRC